MTKENEPSYEAFIQDDVAFKHAWEFYSLADTILHSRIQTSMIAQSFLVAATAVLLTASNSDVLIKLFGIEIGILGLLITYFWNVKSIGIHKKMVHLRNKWFKGHGGTIFKDYIRKGSGMPKDSGTILKRDVQTWWAGATLLLFWTGVVAMWIYKLDVCKRVPSLCPW
ncbi:hypothetical protein [Hoeflea sp. TYP-13]|uniref:hypothetical protein n=1 Tax=Hoeflea sp. TYP-13 TaxID=3230023 RepID=UPI0034C6D765